MGASLMSHEFMNSLVMPCSPWVNLCISKRLAWTFAAEGAAGGRGSHPTAFLFL